MRVASNTRGATRTSTAGRVRRDPIRRAIDLLCGHGVVVHGLRATHIIPGKLRFLRQIFEISVRRARA